MVRQLVIALTLGVTLALVPCDTARADVVDDADCRGWEHWQGGHEGGCHPGPRWLMRCAITPSGSQRGALGLAASASVLGALGARRRARARSRASA